MREHRHGPLPAGGVLGCLRHRVGGRAFLHRVRAAAGGCTTVLYEGKPAGTFLAGERLDPETCRWARELLGIPVIDHRWQTETGWAIAANPMGLEPMEDR